MAELNARRHEVGAFEKARETFARNPANVSDVDASCCVAVVREKENEWTELAWFLFSAICWGNSSQSGVSREQRIPRGE